MKGSKGDWVAALGWAVLGYQLGSMLFGYIRDGMFWPVTMAGRLTLVTVAIIGVTLLATGLAMKASARKNRPD